MTDCEFSFANPNGDTSHFLSVPEGQQENSPAFQRWEKAVEGGLVPKGRLNPPRANTSVFAVFYFLFSIRYFRSLGRVAS